MDTVLGVLVVVGWVVAVSKLLIAVDRFITGRAARRREEEKAEARATAVVVAIDAGDSDGLLYALGLVDPVIEPGLNLLDEAELVAAYADPSFGPDDITGGSAS